MLTCLPPESAPNPPEPRRAVLREVGLVFLGATAACALLYALRNLHPLLANNLPALVALVFWLLPLRLLERQGRSPADYGLKWRPVFAHLGWAALAMIVVFPLFLIGFRLYYGALCTSLRPAFCAHFAPSLWRSRGIRLPPQFALAAAAQLIVVAIPEEFFFRGYLQGRLRAVFSPGGAILLSSLLFGLGHYLVDFAPARLAVAFPAVLFGLLRERTGSILPGALFHAACNLYIDALHRTLFT
jgi:membrane protease YdiL (CAAX protease family)